MLALGTDPHRGRGLVMVLDCEQTRSSQCTSRIMGMMGIIGVVSKLGRAFIHVESDVYYLFSDYSPIVHRAV